MPAPVTPLAKSGKTESKSDLPATRRTSSAPGTLPAAFPPANTSSADFDLPIGAPVVAAPIAPATPAPISTPAPTPAPVFTAPAADVRVSEAYDEPRRRGMPIGAWIGIAGAIAFGIALAVMIGIKFIFVEEPVVATNTPEVETPVRDPGLDLVEPEQPVVEEPEVQEETEVATNMEQRPRNPNAGTMTQETQPQMRELTAAERAILERAGQETGVTPTLMVQDNLSGEGGANLRSLDEAAIGRVVTANRPSLQRCFTTAIRGLPEAPTVRVNVQLTISPGGRVSNVSASAAQPIGNLLPCVESSVSRWVFPRSNGATTTRFPVLFTGAS
jgi:hypothetical protein